MDANRLKAYFDFSKKERHGIVALLAILIVVWSLPSLLSPGNQLDENGFEQFKNDIAQLDRHNNQNKDDDEIASVYVTQTDAAHREPEKVEMFYFDPNTLSVGEWKRMGIPDRTVRTIQNFLAKGGKFYHPEDLAKIYGLKTVDYKRMFPYIRIADHLLPNEKHPIQKTANTPFPNNPNYHIPIVNVNTADTTEFIALPGIGSKLASRIISFREKLGGFYSVDQVAEVYGISDSVFLQIKAKLECNPMEIRKININSATLEELKSHPYIKYQVANAVVQYRSQHGNFQSADDLKQIHVITEEQLKRWVPYLIY